MAHQLAPGPRDSPSVVSIRTPPPEADEEQSGRAWARQVRDPWDPAILTLDGGGIRGYSSLLILQNLMHEIAEWERLLDAEEEEAARQSATDVEASQEVPNVARSIPSIATNQDAITDTPREVQNGMESSQIISGQPPQPSTASHDFVQEPRTNTEQKDNQNTSAVKTVKAQEKTTTLRNPSDPASSSVHDSSHSAHITSLPTRSLIDENNLKPCHYFDFMYGTSTGGLIATLLGRLRLTVPQCLEIYREVGNDLFGTKRSGLPFATKYDHRPLEEAVKKIVKKHCLQHDNCDGEDWHPWNMEDDWEEGGPTDRICQTICLTAIHNGKIDEAYLLRTYPHYYPEGTPNWITLYNEGADPLRIWQVTRATSAAPFYFQVLEAEIRNQVVGFKDGGIRENNPSGAAYGEFISMYGAEAEPGLLLSIGTGRPEENAGDGFASAWPGPLAGNRIMRKASEKFAVLRNVLIKYTEGEKQHEATRYMAKGENRWYKRLNVASGMEGMKLDDWKRGKWFDPEKQEERIVPGGASLTRMENAVKIMMERDYDAKYDSYAPPSTMVRQAAEKLVRMRRLREKLGKEGDKKWDSFMGKTLTDFGRPVEHESEQAFPDPSLPQLPKMRTNERLDMPNYLNPQLPRASSRVPKPTP